MEKKTDTMSFQAPCIRRRTECVCQQRQPQCPLPLHTVASSYMSTANKYGAPRLSCHGSSALQYKQCIGTPRQDTLPFTLCQLWSTGRWTLQGHFLCVDGVFALSSFCEPFDRNQPSFLRRSPSCIWIYGLSCSVFDNRCNNI